MRSDKIKDADWKWILWNSFEVEDIIHYLKRHKKARDIGKVLQRKCLRYCLKSIKDKKQLEKYIFSASKEISLEIEKFQRADRIYWQQIIDELKKLNRSKKLLNIGSRPG